MTQPARASKISIAKVFIFFSLAALLLFSAACGKRRPPLPPVERVPQRTDLLSGIQRGNEVILSFPAPRRNASDADVASIRRIDVYRLAEPTNAPLELTEEEFGERSTLIGSAPYDVIRRSKESLTYTDTLTLTEPVRLRYAVRYVNANDQRAAFSNFLLVEPAAKISEPPTITFADTINQNTLLVRWQPPAKNVDGTTPANLLGYNVYRTNGAQNEAGQTPLNGQTPLTGTEFADQNFSFGAEYTYIVRAVSLGTGGAQVESLNSNPKAITPRDIYPPSKPTGLRPIATPLPTPRISLFFAANQERDVAGYNVFRSTDPNAPKPWTLLTKTLLTRTTFNDDRVERGKTYYYYIEAVDAAGNKSEPSDVVSETVP